MVKLGSGNLHNHSWRMYANPRNGKVRIRACSVCGVAQGMGGQVQRCKMPKSGEHRLLALGWLETSNKASAKQKQAIQNPMRQAV